MKLYLHPTICTSTMECFLDFIAKKTFVVFFFALYAIRTRKNQQFFFVSTIYTSTICLFDAKRTKVNERQLFQFCCWIILHFNDSTWIFSSSFTLVAFFFFLLLLLLFLPFLHFFYILDSLSLWDSPNKMSQLELPQIEILSTRFGLV